jgi:UDP-N-acetylglucosamine 2-epimerase
MTKARIVEVAAARLNIMRVAPVHREASRSKRIEPVLVHDQHYDKFMSDVFFSDLALHEPEINLDIGPGTCAEQTAGVLTGLEPHFEDIRPSAVLVVGDVNSTLDAALCAAKRGIRDRASCLGWFLASRAQGRIEAYRRGGEPRCRIGEVCRRVVLRPRMPSQAPVGVTE